MKQIEARTNCRLKTERGTQIVELALVVPLLAFLALVVSEGAGMVRAHQVLNNAAREGARLAAQPENNPFNSSPVGAIQQTVSQYACNNRVALGNGVVCSNGLACDTPSITVNQAVSVVTSSGVNLTASQVTVQCGYRLTYLPRLPLFQVPSLIPLTATAQFRNLY